MEERADGVVGEVFWWRLEQVWWDRWNSVAGARSRRWRRQRALDGSFVNTKGSSHKTTHPARGLQRGEILEYKRTLEEDARGLLSKIQ